MAIVKEGINSRLQLHLEMGTDSEGNPITRVRSFSNVKPDALDQDVFDVAQTLANLQSHPLVKIGRIDENSLVSM